MHSDKELNEPKTRPVKEILQEIAVAQPSTRGQSPIREKIPFINTEAVANIEQEKAIKKMRWDDIPRDAVGRVAFALDIVLLNSLRG